MKKHLILILVCISFAISTQAQQDAQYSMYMFNGLYLNPAYAGSQEVISTTALYRHQWVGVEGAPRSASFAIHSPFKRDQYALGGIVSFDKLGLDQTYSAYLSYAYRLRFKKGMKLSFGIQAGGQYYQSNLQKADLPGTPFDISFSENRSLFLPNVGFGVYFYSKKFYAGVSVPHIINMSLSEAWSTSQNRKTVAKMYNHYLFTAGGVIGRDESKVKFKPSTLVKYVAGAPVNWDITASFLFINRLWVGASYRLGLDKSGLRGNRIIGLAEFKITPQLRVGYAYDYDVDNLRSLNFGSHEIMLGYDFGFDKTRFVTPRYVSYF